MGTVDLGDRITLTWPLGSSGTVTVTVTAPDGSTSSPAVTGTSTYTAAFTTSQAGRHTVLWASTGATVADLYDEFEVVAQAAIVSLADVKEFLGNTVNTASDDKLRMFALAASEVVEQYTGRTYRRATKTEAHDGGKSAINLRSTPVISVTSVVDSGGTLSTGDYTVNLNAGIIHRGSTLAPIAFIWGRQNIIVTYVAGTTVVPARIRMATLEIVRNLWSSQRGAAARPQVVGQTEPADSVGMTGRIRQLLDSDKAPGF